jgi:hypothetical protein
MNYITLQSERYNLAIFAREQGRIKMGHPLYIYSNMHGCL